MEWSVCISPSRASEITILMASSSNSETMDDKLPEQFDQTTRLSRLYPSVKDFEKLPSFWNQKDKHDFIGLSNGNLTVNYKGAAVKVIYYFIYYYNYYCCNCVFVANHLLHCYCSCSLCSWTFLFTVTDTYLEHNKRYNSVLCICIK